MEQTLNTASSKQICFIGAGSMAEAILRGIIEQQTFHADHISAINRSNHQRLEQLRQQYHIQVAFQPEQRASRIREADILVLAMKPQHAHQALTELAPHLHDGQLLISVIAGIPMATLLKLIGKPLPVVRTMPNTSSAIGLGATGMTFSPAVTAEQRKDALAIFEAIGIVEQIEEGDLHAVTALSGSGPAYIYYIMEAMIETAVESGLSLSTARNLAIQTIAGAAEMVKQTEENPETLRTKVTSPNGTTFAALQVMEQQKLKETIKQAMKAAMDRSRELGEQLK